jgi:deoxyhypusine synthase
MQADYTPLLPFLVKALLENRARYAASAESEGEEKLFEREPHACGYLRPREGYRLFERRDTLVARLMEEVRNNGEWLADSLRHPIAAQR